MLVLSRKIGERIHVGDVVFTIMKISKERVRVGIEAPEQVRILRGEINDETRHDETIDDGQGS